MAQLTMPFRVCAVGVFALACNDQPTEPGPAELVIVQAPSTVGAPGWELIDTLVVRAVDPSGAPRSGVTVTWAVRQGGGSIEPAAETTDGDGYAKAVWTLGATSGLNKVRASTVNGAQADFESTGETFRVDGLSASSTLACGLVTGDLWCWGADSWASTSPASHLPQFGWTDESPGLVDDSREFGEVAVSFTSVCATDLSGGTWCANEASPSMSSVPGLPPIRGIVGTNISLGYCGIALSDSTAWCWSPPGGVAQVASSPHFTLLSIDGRFARGGITVCGLHADSTAACWGPGPLGDGTTDSSATPVVVSGGHRFVEIAVGDGFACGREAEGKVWCWGEDEVGPDVLLPTEVLTGALSLSAGWQWAQVVQASGQQGRWEGAGLEALAPVLGVSGLPVESFASNSEFCLRLVDGQAYCYGEIQDRSSAWYYEHYFPVQPVRQNP